MRRREKPRPAEELHEEPPAEIVRFIPSQPEPWVSRWEPAEFAAFLRARAAWRDTHEKPLYGLYARERSALHGMAGRLPRALVAAEESHWPRAPIPPFRPASARRHAAIPDASEETSA